MEKGKVGIMALEDYYKPMKVQRVQRSNNGMGGYSEVWNDHLDIYGLINMADSKEIIIADRQQIKSTHKLFTDAGQDIASGDRVIYQNQIYRITSIPKDTANLGHHYKIMLEFLGCDNNV